MRARAGAEADTARRGGTEKGVSSHSATDFLLELSFLRNSERGNRNVRYILFFGNQIKLAMSHPLLPPPAQRRCDGHLRHHVAAPDKEDVRCIFGSAITAICGESDI
jgi:hypothetical protein